MPPKKVGGSPVKKKTVTSTKAAVPGADGVGDITRVGGAGDAGLAGAGQDNDEMDGYHEPVGSECNEVAW